MAKIGAKIDANSKSSCQESAKIFVAFLSMLRACLKAVFSAASWANFAANSTFASPGQPFVSLRALPAFFWERLRNSERPMHQGSWCGRDVSGQVSKHEMKAKAH